MSAAQVAGGAGARRWAGVVAATARGDASSDLLAGAMLGVERPRLSRRNSAAIGDLLGCERSTGNRGRDVE